MGSKSRGLRLSQAAAPPVRTSELSAKIRRSMADEEEPQEPHDVLAAEEFVVPAPDPLLQHEPLNVPDDPDDPEGESPPHDVLAGEEFPIPAAPGRTGEGEGTEPASAGGSGGRSKAKAGVIGAVAVGIAAMVRRRRGRKRA